MQGEKRITSTLLLDYYTTAKYPLQAFFNVKDVLFNDNDVLPHIIFQLFHDFRVYLQKWLHVLWLSPYKNAKSPITIIVETHQNEEFGVKVMVKT